MGVFEYILLFLIMIIAHIIADYNLQGVLAQMKQKSEWISRDDYDPELNENDYKTALLTHSIEWTFVIFLPIIVFGYIFDFGYKNSPLVFTVVFCMMCMLHYKVDNLKANEKTISLTMDQYIHLAQICFIYIIGVAAI